MKKARRRTEKAKTPAAQTPASKSPASLAPFDRRKEWRFRLPLTAMVQGQLPRGEKFQEQAIIENISSTGAYFCLDSGVAVGSKVNVMIELPPELGGGQKMKLLLGGITIRLEEVDKKDKRQGVAVRFKKDFKVIPQG